MSVQTKTPDVVSPAEYRVPAQLMQHIVNVLGALPWAQVNHVMQPLQVEIQKQEQVPPVG